MSHRHTVILVAGSCMFPLVSCNAAGKMHDSNIGSRHTQHQEENWNPLS
jgi:hypothetical protein